MTVAKAIIKSLTKGIDVRVGWDDDENATDEERTLAVELAMVMNEYMTLKKGGAQ